jgi:hypothetical protein
MLAARPRATAAVLAHRSVGTLPFRRPAAAVRPSAVDARCTAVRLTAGGGSSAGFATAAAGTPAEQAAKRAAAGTTARWTAALGAAGAVVYAIDRRSDLIGDTSPAPEPATATATAAADSTKAEPSAAAAAAPDGLTDMQKLTIGYAGICAGAIVGWRLYRFSRPFGSYIADLRESPHGVVNWRGGAPRMFSVNNTLGRTFLGSTSVGIAVLTAALLDGRADDDDGAAAKE